MRALVPSWSSPGSTPCGDHLDGSGAYWPTIRVTATVCRASQRRYSKARGLWMCFVACQARLHDAVDWAIAVPSRLAQEWGIFLVVRYGTVSHSSIPNSIDDWRHDTPSCNEASVLGLRKGF